MVHAGQAALSVALLAAATTITLGWRAARHPESVSTKALRLAAATTFAGLFAAVAVLEHALITNDFSFRYVAEHHSSASPLFFTIANLWAGLEGSLLLWSMLTGLYLMMVSRSWRRRDPADRLAAGALCVTASIAAFFIGVVLFVTPVFASVGHPPAEGFGANALLQDNFLMVIHPPLLYLGYIGFVVPFSFALSALALREGGAGWVLRTQAWTVLAWVFLTAGIVIGGWWSYEVLGWGGYWAWDPVENASFLPWLAGTAFLHSAVAHARRKLLPAWSVALIISAFLLTLLGTFLARSGVIASVHAFSQSNLGPVLLGFLIFATAVSGWLFLTRMKDVATAPPLDTIVSREGMFLINNLLLATFALVVLLGTAFPIFVEATTGSKVSVGRPFFDRMAIPISLTLVVAMAIGVVTPYRRARPVDVWNELRLSVQVGLAIAATAVLFGLREPYVLFVLVVAGTVAMTALRQYFRAVQPRLALGESSLTAARQVLTLRPGYWGGQLAHIGVAVVALGIATSGGLADRSTLTFIPTQTIHAAGFTITYVHPTARQTPTHQVRGALFQVTRGDRTRLMEPTLRKYPNQVQELPGPDIWTTSRGDDLYTAIVGLDSTSVTLRLYRYPFIYLVWIGGLLTATGGAVGLLLRLLRRRPASPSTAAETDDGDQSGEGRSAATLDPDGRTAAVDLTV
jgi:cytochrome c-type biogenesis protein CcmF